MYVILTVRLSLFLSSADFVVCRCLRGRRALMPSTHHASSLVILWKFPSQKTCLVCVSK